MTEEELARRAVERGAITEDQLREARSFAEGGRSLLSVLLDLGYLRADQLPGILAPPAVPAAPSLSIRLSRGFFLFLISFLLGWTCRPRSPRYPDLLEIRRQNDQLRQALARANQEKEELRARGTVAPRHPPSRLREAGRTTLAAAENRLGEEGRLTPETRDLFLEGAVLLEMSSTEESLDESDELMLGRGWEILRKWDKAYASYGRILQKNPHHSKALLGAARSALEQEDLPTALRHADEAVRHAPSGEAFLLRGRAQMRAGRKEPARLDFLRARELDPALAPLVAHQLERLSRE